jgi:hypothetical protein
MITPGTCFFVGEALQHNADGEMSYSRDEFYRRWRQKLNAVMTAGVGGLQAYPNFRMTGQVISLPFIPRPAAVIHDSERRKDTSKLTPQGECAPVCEEENEVENGESEDLLELDREVVRFLIHFKHWKVRVVKNVGTSFLKIL